MNIHPLAHEEQTHRKDAKKAPRLFSIDALRGIIMVLMALDHANYFISNLHSAGEYWGGTPLPIYNDPFVFFTRFITHLAAPGFFFLMGTGMILFTNSRQKQGWKKSDIICHFFIRGGLLMTLQLLVVNRVWASNLNYIYIGVLFALGGTMIVGILLLWFKPKYLAVVSISLTLGMAYQITELIGIDWNNFTWDLPNLMFMTPGGPTDGNMWSNYPILPWLGLVLFGIIFGY